MDLFADLFVPGVSVVEKIVRPLVIYVFLVLILRLGGRRELSQMNAFDLVVLLTLSNTVQNAIIGNDNSLVGGIIGATTLVLANVLVDRFLYHHPEWDRKLGGEPVTLVRDGRLVRQNLEHELITEEEVLAAVHRQGVETIEDCDRVILETSGTITVLARKSTADEAATLARLERIEHLLDRLAARSP